MLPIQCARCKTCCTEPLIPINDVEVGRLMKATGLPARRIVAFLSNEELDWDEKSRDWVDMAVGTRIMTLRHKGGKCIFLGKNGCNIYENRPGVCRLFPVDLFFDERFNLSDHDVQSRVDGCKAVVRGHPEKNKALVAIGRKLDIEDFQYYAKVAIYNEKEARGTISHFLRFLGLE